MSHLIGRGVLGAEVVANVPHPGGPPGHEALFMRSEQLLTILCLPIEDFLGKRGGATPSHSEGAKAAARQLP